MANNCGFELKVTGRQKDVEAFKAIALCEDKSRAFARVYFAAENFSEYADGKGYSRIFGDCAWSLSSSICDPSYKASDPIYTTLAEESARLNLTIEAYSAEAGCGFMEHFVYINGVEVEHEVVEYAEYCTEDYESVEELNAEFGTNFTAEEFEAEDYLTTGGMDWDFADWTNHSIHSERNEDCLRDHYEFAVCPNFSQKDMAFLLELVDYDLEMREIDLELAYDDEYDDAKAKVEYLRELRAKFFQ